MSFESFSTTPSPEKRRREERVPGAAFEEPAERLEYHLHGLDVSLAARHFAPESGERPEGEAVVFLTGWGASVEDGNVKNVGERAAEEWGCEAYAIEAHASERGAQAKERHIHHLATEAEAVAEFLRGKHLKKVTLIGHSQGGNRALNLAFLLEHAADVSLEGTVLIGSAGLQKDNELAKLASLPFLPLTAFSELLRGFARGPEQVSRTLGVMTDVGMNVAGEAARSGLGYSERQATEAAEAGEVNPVTKKLHSPVVVVEGAYDQFAPAERIKASLAELFPGAPHAYIELKGGHNEILIEPQEVLPLARRKLEELRASPTLH